MDKFLKFIEDNSEKLIGAAIVIVVGFILVKLLLFLLDKTLKRSKLDKTAYRFILSFSRALLYVILAMVILSKLNFDMNSLVALMGAVGIAIGLAIQGTVANITGGITILMNKPFVAGDLIEVNTVLGTVSSINIFRTKIFTIDNKVIFIPNSEISSSKIINYSAEKTRRLDLVFSISYQNDFTIAKDLINAVVEVHEDILADPAPLVRVTELSQNSIDIAVKVWTPTEKYWDVRFDLLEQVKLSFDKNGVIIPYNQLDVHVIK